MRGSCSGTGRRTWSAWRTRSSRSLSPWMISAGESSIWAWRNPVRSAIWPEPSGILKSAIPTCITILPAVIPSRSRTSWTRAFWIFWSWRSSLTAANMSIWTFRKKTCGDLSCRRETLLRQRTRSGRTTCRAFPSSARNRAGTAISETGPETLFPG